VVIAPPEDISSVCPSGADFATSTTPILPFAPGRFSTTTGWPSVSWSFAPSARPIWSAAPPGGKFTTMRSDLAGKVCD
jgi:hypothetical protein